ncbi:MAG TPA: phage/plasmid primase, P4 family [Jiangellaceae bacterium]|nr:phage/plasmid primase, P4 family [Jiangellaceae bacterium]
MGDQYGENSIDLTAEMEGSPEADLANGRRLADAHGDRLRYVVPWSTWLCWDGTRWAPDDTGQAVRYAKAVADTLPKTVGRSGTTPSRAQTAAGINAMLAMAATEPGIAVAPSALDADPHLLNTSNGTVDLHTGHLRPHDPADLITKVCGAAYHPGAEAPKFREFLRKIQPEAEMREFLGRLFGHALPGVVTEHVLVVLYGIGANGKSTLTETVSSALGDYAAPVDPAILLERFSDAHPTGLASLFGLRLAITSETDQGRRLAEATVKKLTGGDEIAARRMRENYWTFRPSHTLVMLTNHKPLIRGDDEGIWRRLRLVPFDVVVPEDERDGKLPEKLHGELDGVLAWLVDGYMQWKSRGLAEPAPVTNATATYRTESDLLGLFLAERTMPNPHAHVRSADLFAAWVEWCKRENVDAGTQTAFSRTLQDRGFDKEHKRVGALWRGIGLYADEPGQ